MHCMGFELFQHAPHITECTNRRMTIRSGSHIQTCMDKTTCSKREFLAGRNSPIDILVSRKQGMRSSIRKSNDQWKACLTNSIRYCYLRSLCPLKTATPSSMYYSLSFCYSWAAWNFELSWLTLPKC